MAIVDAGASPAACAVWRHDEDGIDLRHPFVVREHRRAHVGSRAFALLRVGWPVVPIKLDVLLHNEGALAFRRRFRCAVT